MNNKTYVDVMVDDVKPDPHQPRKHISKEHIDNLAKNIQHHGMIHPIVVDSDMKIIVGECRWRAAKQLGLETIKAVVEEEKMDSYERFTKQMSENSVRSSVPGSEELSVVDMANAYARMLLMKTYKDRSPGDLSRILDYSSKELYRVWHDAEHEKIYKIVKQCAEDIGKDEHTIREYLNLLNEPEPVLEAVNNGEVPRTYIREANRAPEEFKQKIKENVVSGKYANREQITKAVDMVRKIPDAMREEINRGARSKIAEYILEAANKMLLVLVKVDLKKFSEDERTFITKKLKSVADRIYDFCDGIKIDAYAEEKEVGS